jgi:Bacterial Ig-like domain (group 2)
MRSSRVWVGLVLSGSAAIANCGESPVMPDRCNIRLAVVSPDPATLVVGQEVTLEAQLTSSTDCLPADARVGSLRWSSETSGVAVIDPVSGRVKAVSAGTAQVSLQTAVTHTVLATSVVQVAP